MPRPPKARGRDATGRHRVNPLPSPDAFLGSKRGQLRSQTRSRPFAQLGSGSDVEGGTGGKNVFAWSFTRLETRQSRAVWTATSDGHGACTTGGSRVPQTSLIDRMQRKLEVAGRY